MIGTPDDSPTQRSDASRRRQRSLDAKIEALLAGEGERPEGGWQLESRSETRAVLTRTRHVNHRLHLILTILTLGFWVFVWMVLAAHSNEPQRKILKA